MVKARREVRGISAVGANLIGVERAEKAVWRSIAEGRSAAVETVLSSPKFVPVVLAATQNGYRTRLIFVALPSVDVSIARVRARKRMGGHGVPMRKLRVRWVRTHANLLVFLPLVDDLQVFSNANEPAIIGERHGRDGELRILDANAAPVVTRLLLRALT